MTPPLELAGRYAVRLDANTLLEAVRAYRRSFERYRDELTVEDLRVIEGVVCVALGQAGTLRRRASVLRRKLEAAA